MDNPCFDRHYFRAVFFLGHVQGVFVRRVNFVLRDVCRSFVIGGVIGLGGGVILSGYGPFMWLCFGTCGAAAAASRAVHWRHRRFRLIRYLNGRDVY